MKLTNREWTAQAPRLAREARLFFLCGPDEAGAALALRQLAGLLPDPGERVELSGAELRADPARLGDEARSASLFATGARHIYARVAGDDAFEAVRNLLETGDAGAGAACPVLIAATGATDKSRTAKLLADRKDAVVGVFYQPDLRTVLDATRRLGEAAGLRLSADLAERIARQSSLDLRLVESELEKLALFCDAAPQAPVTVDAEAIAAIGAITQEEDYAALVNAALSGDGEALGRELARMEALGSNAVGVLLAVERRAAQLVPLARAAGEVGIDSALEAAQRTRAIFWRDRPDFKRQLACWRPEALDRLVERLALLHRRMLNDNAAAPLLLAAELSAIARAAARG